MNIPSFYRYLFLCGQRDRPFDNLTRILGSSFIGLMWDCSHGCVAFEHLNNRTRKKPATVQTPGFTILILCNYRHQSIIGVENYEGYGSR